MNNKQLCTQTAGIIVIGNEILSGKVHDVNSFYLASELRKLGVDVRCISVIPDEAEIIGEKTVEFSKKYSYVFTTGGIGPTHDDVTISGISKGFGLKIVQHPEIKKILSEKYNNLLNEAVLKMAEVPEGAEVIFYKDMRFPIIYFKNIYIFPGIPEYLKNKFPFIRDRFISSPFYIKRVFLNTHESDIAETLNKIVTEHDKVTIGSYPDVSNTEYRVVITVESKSEDSLNRAFNDMVKRLPVKIIIRTE